MSKKVDCKGGFFGLELSSQVQRLIKKDFMRSFPTQAFAGPKVELLNKVSNIIIRTECNIKGFGQVFPEQAICDIAKKVGIATGTFYNFFSSKEEFVYQIVLVKRAVIKGYYDDLIKDGKIGGESFKEYLRTIYLADSNIFDYLDDSEIAILTARWPEEYWINSENDQMTS